MCKLELHIASQKRDAVGKNFQMFHLNNANVVKQIGKAFVAMFFAKHMETQVLMYALKLVTNGLVEQFYAVISVHILAVFFCKLKREYKQPIPK